MTAQTQHILESIFSKNTLDDIPEDELKKLVHDHPYFTLGHYLLLKKLKHSGNEWYDAQLKRTALHFHESFWLHWLLKQNDDGKPAAEFQKIVEEQKVAEEPLETEPEVTPLKMDLDQQNENELPLNDLDKETSEQHPIEYQVATNGVADEHELATEVVEATVVIDEAEPVEKAGDIIGEEVKELPFQQDVDIISHCPDQIDHVQSEEKAEATEDKQASISVIGQPVVEELPELAFEPYHTIDYFASQGIKISAEVKPDDKLGRQLKSFTEWLKTMRKLPQTQLQPEIEETSQQVQEFAEHSLESKEVITEAMAEVLLKQDKKGEARSIYEKLSLLNPSKRAYFAAKIEQLKES